MLAFGTHNWHKMSQSFFTAIPLLLLLFSPLLHRCSAGSFYDNPEQDPYASPPIIDKTAEKEELVRKWGTDVCQNSSILHILCCIAAHSMSLSWYPSLILLPNCFRYYLRPSQPYFTCIEHSFHTLSILPTIYSSNGILVELHRHLYVRSSQACEMSHRTRSTIRCCHHRRSF